MSHRNTTWMALLLLVLLFASPSQSYDTGHHNDLTRNTLQLFAYNQYAQQIAGISNFFVDYYAFSPLPSERLPELNAMHFDNIFTMKNASNYWSQLTLNTKKAIQQAATSGDALDFIMTIGGTLHSVQDFYTHSTWVDSHYRTECDCYRSDTWIGAVHATNGDFDTLLDQLSAIHTYSYGDCDQHSRNCFPGQLPHGDACGGINKDSYVRPYWEQSYGFAFSASVEWLDNIHQWASEINSTIIGRAQNYTPPTQGDIDDLNKLDEYVHTVSYAVKFREENGHWKGPGSGSLKRFVPASVEFIASKSIYKSKYQDEKIHLRWSLPSVYDAPDVPNPTDSVDISAITQVTRAYSGLDTQFTPVVVRTVSVNGHDKANTPSYFAVVNIDGLEFVETVQIDQFDFKPHWTSIKFVNSTAKSVPILYTLKDNHFPKSDEVVSITQSGSSSLSLNFEIATHTLSGDISGVFDSRVKFFNTSSSDQDVSVSIFVTANRFANCRTGLPQQYCPNEAYVSEGVFGECFDSREQTVPSTGDASTFAPVLALLLAVAAFVYL